MGLALTVTPSMISRSNTEDNAIKGIHVYVTSVFMRILMIN
jgi:hypothetical protein